MKLDFNFNGKTRLKNWWKQVLANFTAVEKDHNALDTKVTQEIADRKSADSTLLNKITAEETARTNADNAEAAARQSADTALGQRITDETADRKSADDALEGRIAQEVVDRENGDFARMREIGDETTARKEADAALGQRITDEAAARQSADSSHADKSANAAVFGHVQLTDTIDTANINNNKGAADSIAATPKAVIGVVEEMYGDLASAGHTHQKSDIIGLSDIETKANEASAAAATARQEVAAERSARQSADNELKESIAKVRYDYFGDGSLLKFEWSGNLSVPYLKNGKPVIDINLSGMFKLDGVARGIMDTETIELYDEGYTYIYAEYAIEEDSIVVNKYDTFDEPSSGNGLYSLTVLKCKTDSSLGYVEQEAYTAEFVVEGEGFADKIEQNRSDIAAIRYPAFTEADSRSNIASGETLSTLFGKIKKWFSDLKAVAFSGSYSDLTNKPTIPTKVSQLTNDSGYKTIDTTYENATTSAAGLMSTSDKSKLDGIASGANNYTHPSSHGAGMITQDSTHRFVSDAEKSVWNDKLDYGFFSNGFAGIDEVTDGILQRTRTATFVVASSNSSEKSRLAADYRCDGTADQEQINAAIAALPSNGGKVILLEGTYNISGTINVNKKYTVIEGMGYGTTTINSTVPVGYSGIYVSAQSCFLKNFALINALTTKNVSGIYVTGLYANMFNVKSAGFQYGINFTNTATNNYAHLDFMRVENNTIGIHLNCKHAMVTNSFVNGNDTGINIEQGRNFLSNIYINDCTVGCYIKSGAQMNILIGVFIRWTSEPDSTKHSFIINSGYNWFYSYGSVMRLIENNSSEINYFSVQESRTGGN